MRLERGRGAATLRGMTQRSPFRYFKTPPEIIQLAVMLGSVEQFGLRASYP